MANKKIEKNKQEQIIKLHLEGKNATEVGRIVGVGHSTVSRYVAEHTKAEATIRDAKLRSLKKARKALAAKRANGQTVPFKKESPTYRKNLQERKAAQPKAPELHVRPSPDATVRELARAAATLGLEVHFQFVEKA